MDPHALLSSCGAEPVITAKWHTKNIAQTIRSIICRENSCIEHGTLLRILRPTEFLSLQNHYDQELTYQHGNINS